MGIVERGLHDDRHIGERCVVVLVVKAAGVDKVGIFEAQFLRLFVHERCKRLLRARRDDGERFRRLCAGGENRAVEKLRHGDLLPMDKARHARVGQKQRVNDRLRHGERFVPVFNVLRGHENGHDLRHRGGVDARVGVFLDQDGVRLQIDEQRVFAVKLQIECFCVFRYFGRRIRLFAGLLWCGSFFRFGLLVRIQRGFGFRFGQCIRLRFGLRRFWLGLLGRL